MQKILLIATLSLATFAWAQPMADESGNTQSADEDFYSQKVNEQADLNSGFLDASRLAASAEPQGWSASEQPGSMASNAGSQEISEGGDMYDETVAIQANVNRLLFDASRQQ
jgi:hypothetical protein